MALLGDLRPIGVLNNADLLVALLATVAGTLAAIIGIVIAVVLVALEVMRTAYASYAVREVLRSPTLQQLMTLYLFTVALSLVTLALVEEPVPHHVSDLTYLIIGLSIVCLAVLYPATHEILSSARPNQRRIAALGGELTLERVAELAHISRSPLGQELTLVEAHPLFVLSEVARRSIRDGDRIAPRQVVLESGKRLAAIIDMIVTPVQSEGEHFDFQYVRSVIEPFLIVFRAVVTDATEHRDEATLVFLVGVLEEIHHKAAKLRLPWYTLIEFDETLEKLLVGAAVNGLDTVATHGCWSVERIQLAHLRHNVPPEDEIFVLHWRKRKPGEKSADEAKDWDHDKSNQWQNVSQRYIRMLDTVTSTAVKADHAGIASTAMIVLGELLGEVLRLESLGKEQKHDVMRWLAYRIHDQTVTASHRFGEVPTLAVYGLGYLHITRELTDPDWGTVGLSYLCLTIRRLADKRVLNRFLLNELGSVGRGCVGKIDEHQRYAEAILLIADTMKEVAIAYSEPTSLDDVLVLKETKDQLESFRRWFVAEKKEHPDAQARVEESIRAVSAIEVPTRYERAHSIEWPSLSPSGEARSKESSNGESGSPS